jgi:hypothetical protein
MCDSIIYREISISEEDLETLNNCIEFHINKLKGRIKQLDTTYTGKAENRAKKTDLKFDIEYLEGLRTRLAEPFI